MRQIYVTIGIIFLIILVGVTGLLAIPGEQIITSYKECVGAKFLVMQAGDGSGMCRTPDGRTFYEKASLSPESSSVSSAEAIANITVATPEANEIVQKTFTVSGTARVFENVLNYRVKDEKGMIIAEGYSMADAPDIGQFGPYSFSVDATKAMGTKLTLQVFSESAKDGTDINVVTIPLTLAL